MNSDPRLRPTNRNGEPRLRKRLYPVRRGRRYSLREAAVALAVPEGQLRRAILLDDLPSLDVADDRQYLLEGETLQEYVCSLRPGEDCRFESDELEGSRPLGLLVLFPMILMIGAISWVGIAQRTPEPGGSRQTQKVDLPGNVQESDDPR